MADTEKDDRYVVNPCESDKRLPFQSKKLIKGQKLIETATFLFGEECQDVRVAFLSLLLTAMISLPPFPQFDEEQIHSNILYMFGMVLYYNSIRNGKCNSSIWMKTIRNVGFKFDMSDEKIKQIIMTGHEYCKQQFTADYSVYGRDTMYTYFDLQWVTSMICGTNSCIQQIKHRIVQVLPVFKNIFNHYKIPVSIIIPEDNSAVDINNLVMARMAIPVELPNRLTWLIAGAMQKYINVQRELSGPSDDFRNRFDIEWILSNLFEHLNDSILFDVHNYLARQFAIPFESTDEIEICAMIYYLFTQSGSKIPVDNDNIHTTLKIMCCKTISGTMKSVKFVMDCTNKLRNDPSVDHSYGLVHDMINFNLNSIETIEKYFSNKLCQRNCRRAVVMAWLQNQQSQCQLSSWESCYDLFDKALLEENLKNLKNLKNLHLQIAMVPPPLIKKRQTQIFNVEKKNSNVEPDKTVQQSRKKISALQRKLFMTKLQ
jgi:hypothetical protein